MFVVRTDLMHNLQLIWPMPNNVISSLILEPLDLSNNLVRFDTFASKNSAFSSGAEIYELLFQINGKWARAPSHAVYAIWQIVNLEYEEAFVESRRQLFKVRRGRYQPLRMTGSWNVSIRLDITWFWACMVTKPEPRGYVVNTQPSNSSRRLIQPRHILRWILQVYGAFAFKDKRWRVQLQSVQ